VTHYTIIALKQRYPAFGRVVDGMPLVLFERGRWEDETMARNLIPADDVLAVVRGRGLRSMDDVEYAVLERNGDISVIERSRTAGKDMAQRAYAAGGSPAKVNDDIDVGSDLAFQQKWWRFERGIWVALTLVVVLNALGVLGQGMATRAHTATADGAMRVDYQRIARYSTPALVTVHFGPAAIRDGSVRLWASDSLIESLGAQRLLPEPAETTLDGAGLLFTFPSTAQPNSMQFALEPRAIGLQPLTLRIAGGEELRLSMLVLP